MSPHDGAGANDPALPGGLGVTPRRLPGPVSGLSGHVAVPTSKSLTNRALILAAAANGGRIERPLDCEDTRHLAKALEQAGWVVDWGDAIELGTRRAVESASVFLGNSGTGSRLVLALLACVPGRFRIDGSRRLRERPMKPLLDALEALGSDVRSSGGFLPVELTGERLLGGEVRVRPEVSSQFVSALLLAAPLMDRGIHLVVEGPIPSRPYLDLTRDALEAFGATLSEEPGAGWRVEPGGLRHTTFAVEGDWSAAAFVAAAVAVAGGSVAVGPLAENSRQGDREVWRILQRAGLGVCFEDHRVRFSGGDLVPFEADLRNTPDLFPALSVVAAAAAPGSVLTGLENLKHKESDRFAVMVHNLRSMGASFDLGESRILFQRGFRRPLDHPVRVIAAGDHRIAMAMAVAALGAGQLELDDGECVGKSFPGFWQVWEALLGEDSCPP